MKLGNIIAPLIEVDKDSKFKFYTGYTRKKIKFNELIKWKQFVINPVVKYNGAS